MKTGGLSVKRATTIVESEEMLARTVEVMTCLTDVDHGIDLDALPGPSMPRPSRPPRPGRTSPAPSTTSPPPCAVSPTPRPPTHRRARGVAAARPVRPAPTSEAGVAWPHARLVGFDLETTGVDPDTARIVTAAFVEDPDRVEMWLADPGVEIPEAARAVHGITTEYAQANGMPAVEVVTALCTELTGLRDEGRRRRRPQHRLRPQRPRCRGPQAPSRPRPALLLPAIVDTFVLDRRVDRYRRGKRTLTATAEAWDVSLLDAHDAAADARAALDIARALASKSTEIAAYTPQEIMAAQGEWKRAQAADLQAFLRREGQRRRSRRRIMAHRRRG
ncbi:hypothetical protein IOD13_07180 [Brevibacterium casei]|nr:hypothetical protein [Brevibacterium casei]